MKRAFILLILSTSTWSGRGRRQRRSSRTTRQSRIGSTCDSLREEARPAETRTAVTLVDDGKDRCTAEDGIWLAPIDRRADARGLLPLTLVLARRPRDVVQSRVAFTVPRSRMPTRAVAWGAGNVRRVRPEAHGAVRRARVIISAKRRNVFGTIGDGCAEVSTSSTHTTPDRSHRATVSRSHPQKKARKGQP